MGKRTVCALRKKDGSSLLSLNSIADGAAALLANKPPWTPALESDLAHILSPMVLSQVLLHPLIPSCMAVRLFQWACTSSPSLARDHSISEALATSLTCPPRLPHLWPALRSLEVSPLPLPTYFFTALIKHLGEAGLPFHAKQLFFSMYCCPDVYTCTALLHAMLGCNPARTPISISSLTLSMELVCQALDFLDQMSGLDIQPNVVTWNILLNGFLRAGQLKPAFRMDKAVAILTQMEKMGCTPDTVTYTSLIDGLLKANEVNKALVILTQMEKRGCTPNTITYNCLLDGLLKANEVNKALAILTQMEKRGCTPNTITYNSLLDGLLKANEVNKALAILTQMEKRGCTPDTVTYTIFMKWIVKKERLEDALVLLETMHSVGCEPDKVTYTILIDGLLNVNEVNKALVIMTEMEKRRMLPEYSTLQRIYRLACDGVKNEDMKMFE